jgi:hypothetical protein
MLQAPQAALVEEASGRAAPAEEARDVAAKNPAAGRRQYGKNAEACIGSAKPRLPFDAVKPVCQLAAIDGTIKTGGRDGNCTHRVR